MEITQQERTELSESGKDYDINAIYWEGKELEPFESVHGMAMRYKNGKEVGIFTDNLGLVYDVTIYSG